MTSFDPNISRTSSFQQQSMIEGKTNETTAKKEIIDIKIEYKSGGHKPINASEVLKFDLTKSLNLAFVGIHVTRQGINNKDALRIGMGAILTASLPFSLAVGGFCAAISFLDAGYAAIKSQGHTPLFDFGQRVKMARQEKQEKEFQPDLLDNSSYRSYDIVNDKYDYEKK